MSRKFQSYDIELFDELFIDGDKEKSMISLKELRPSVGAFCTEIDDTRFFYDEPYMSKQTAKKMVIEMLEKYHEGFLPFTWNGLAFDFKLLAFYSGMIEECAILALNGIDPMFNVVCTKGYYLGLDTVLRGANIQSKLKTVTFSDGSVDTDMSGAKAPLYWRNGEFDVVKEYLRYDVIQPLKLAHQLEKDGVMRWSSKTGRPMSVKNPMMTVKEAVKLPVPDTSWMDKPKYRHEYYDWIPLDTLRKEGIVESNGEEELPDFLK